MGKDALRIPEHAKQARADAGIDGRRPLASTEEVSEYLGVPVPTLYQWRLRGIGPKASKIGRHLRYRWSEVERFVDEQAAVA